jgi:hypothetical protein
MRLAGQDDAGGDAEVGELVAHLLNQLAAVGDDEDELVLGLADDLGHDDRLA